jgi:hypothetical protein
MQSRNRSVQRGCGSECISSCIHQAVRGGEDEEKSGSYNVVLSNILESLANVFLVDEGLSEGFSARRGLRFSRVQDADARRRLRGARLARNKHI